MTAAVEQVRRADPRHDLSFGGRSTSQRCLPPAGGNIVGGVEQADALLAARLAAGDDHALAEVVDLLGPVVYGAAMRVLGETTAAQDVVQDVFVELWSHPDRYDPGRASTVTYVRRLARPGSYRSG